MLLTVSAQSLWDRRTPRKSVADPLELPRLIRSELEFVGVTLHTTMLAGWEAPLLERFRDECDKLGCPCLLLIEPQSQALGHRDGSEQAAIERIDRVLRAAHKLGCSSVAISIQDPADSTAADTLVERLKAVIGKAERLELNLLLAPAPGLTETPEDLTALIRRVGGFRIGSYPDFETAAASGADPVPYLRSLAPYANAVCASVLDFTPTGEHRGFDLLACVKAITAVGFDKTLTVEYRGKGDPLAALRAAKAAIESCLSNTEPAEDTDE